MCGSGLVDAVAQLLSLGIIDETGRLLDEDEARGLDLPPAIFERFATLDGGARAFRIAMPGETAVLEGINLTQRDIRELQNAKAAIAAGIKTLVSKARLKASDIGRVYLAGGFGNYLRVRSAFDIGLIPREFEGRVTPAGNAAGAGASMALLSTRAAERLAEISGRIKYIELSASAEFTNEYIDCMTFEQ
jgi:uncharacterized 2Fe-2S/4Fe-4S cluster protein (DUF4445 family)